MSIPHMYSYGEFVSSCKITKLKYLERIRSDHEIVVSRWYYNNLWSFPCFRKNRKRRASKGETTKPSARTATYELAEKGK
jgi:hypothetical protein